MNGTLLFLPGMKAKCGFLPVLFRFGILDRVCLLYIVKGHG